MQNKTGELDRLIYRAIVEMGWILPTTIEEVRWAEDAMKENPVELPENFPTAKELWGKIQARKTKKEI